MFYSLPKVIQEKWIHVVAWAVLLLYLAFAHDLHDHFFLRHGKPVLVSAELPEKTGQIFIAIDSFKTTFYDGQYLFFMAGWAFSSIDPAMHPEDYERQVILISNEKSYFFATQNQSRLDIHQAAKSKGMDLKWSGFSALISKEALAPGVYQIGVSFRNPKDGSTYYGKVDKYLIRTPNQFHLSNSLPLP